MTKLTIGLLLFATVVGGCGRSNPPPSAAVSTAGPRGLATAAPLPADMQGDWVFNHARTLAEWKKAMTPTEYQQIAGVANAMAHGAGHQLHPDITIAGSAIDGVGGSLQPSYDLTSWQSNGAVVEGTAIWHEDKHDPGDMTDTPISLKRVGPELWFVQDVNAGPAEGWLVFDRPGASAP